MQLKDLRTETLAWPDPGYCLEVLLAREVEDRNINSEEVIELIYNYKTRQEVDINFNIYQPGLENNIVVYTRNYVFILQDYDGYYYFCSAPRNPPRLLLDLTKLRPESAEV